MKNCCAPIGKISGTTVTYLHQDQQGSTRLLTDASGSAVGTYSYDPYGNVTSHTGSAASALQYNGQYKDAETGYQYLRARYYDSGTAQFLTIDPVFPLIPSRYTYAGENPLNFGDPSGKLPTIVIGAILGAVTGAVSGAVSYTATHWNSGFNWQDLGASTLGGGVSGAITGACLGTGVGLLAATACGAAGGLAGDTVTQSLDTKSGYDLTHLALSTGTGALTGLIGGIGAPSINRGWLALANRNPGGLGATNLLPWATTGNLGRYLQISTAIGTGWGLAVGVPSELFYNALYGPHC